MAAMKKSATYFDLFRNRNYVLLFVGQLISYGGDALSRVALPIYVYQTTESLSLLGSAFALQYAPWILFGPIAGVISDRKNRRALLIGAVWIEALGLMGVLYSHAAWQMLSWILVSAMAQPLKIYVRQAFMPDLVGEELYSRAVSLNIIVVQTTDVLGIALAGGIVAMIGPRRAIMLDVLTFALNSVFIVLAHIPQPHLQRSFAGRIGNEIAEGLTFILQNTGLRFILAVLTLRGLTMIGVFPLFVDFIESVLEKGPWEFGLFTAAASAGYVLSSIFAVRLEKKFSPWAMLLGSTAASGLFLLPFFSVRTFWLLLGVRFLSALFYGAGNLVGNVQIAQLTPSELRGRTTSVAWALIKLSQAISSSGLGLLASFLGSPSVIGLAGVILCLGSCGLGWMARPLTHDPAIVRSND